MYAECGGGKEERIQRERDKKCLIDKNQYGLNIPWALDCTIFCFAFDMEGLTHTHNPNANIGFYQFFVSFIPIS